MDNDGANSRREPASGDKDQPAHAGRWPSLTLTLALAAVLTLLGAVKPLHVDDTTFYFNAVQIADHPLDPYGYTMMRFDEPVPALTALAPPVLPAWWAIAIRLFGPRPMLWKLWLFPFALLFVGSSAALLRRFAAPVAAPLLIFLVLSPVFLPSLNLMLDIPAYGLALTALVLFLHACDRGSPSLAVVAGLTAGLAMQTKYTAFLMPSVMLVHALLNRKWGLGLCAALAAAGTFAAWELALVFRYGQSHFYYQITQGDNGDQPKIMLLGTFFLLLGGAAPTLAPLVLLALRPLRRLFLLLCLIVPLPYVLLAWPDSAVPAALLGGERFLADVLLTCLGAGTLLCLMGAAWRLVRPVRGQPLVSPWSPWGRPVWFLVLWLGLELVGYVVISPFPAVRRIMGTTVAATLVIGRLLTVQAPLSSWRKTGLYGLVVATALLGLGFYSVDYLEARAEQQAAYWAAQRIRDQDPHAVIWYVGYWGFQFYAHETGMKQVVPAHESRGQGSPPDLPATQLHKGDWLVVPDESIPQQWMDLDRRELRLEDRFAVDDCVPLSTLMWYYAGAPPLRSRSAPRVVVRLYRVEDDFVPAKRH